MGQPIFDEETINELKKQQLWPAVSRLVEEIDRLEAKSGQTRRALRVLEHFQKSAPKPKRRYRRRNTASNHRSDK